MDPQLRQLNADGAGLRRTVLDVALVLLVVGAVIAISATAPSTTYTYAQMQQIGAVVGTVQSGNWLLPRDQMRGLARKPQLYAWLDAPVLMATGIYNDFIFRLPTVAASLVAGVLVYFLGRRWYGRRVGLLAACLWATAMHMSKMMYIAVTDMLLAMWIIGAMMCADRLLFHRAPRASRWRWAVALWAMMILGAMTKGWGLLNLILVGGALALATAVGPGFAPLRMVKGFGKKTLLAVRLVLRRWRRAIKATRFGWGMLAMAAVLGPVWVGMFAQGGEEFRRIVHFEFVQRITGGGPSPPHGSSVPAVGHLLYYLLPVSIFMIGAVLLAGPRRWFVFTSPIFLPLCWVLAVVVPFSLTHGFRPDYLLPCYAAAALMAAWAVEEVHRRGPADRLTRALRHVFAAAPVVIGALLIVVPLMYLFHEHMPRFIAKNLKLPSWVPPATWWVLHGLVGLGMVVLILAVRWSLRWQLRRVAAVAVVGMLGVMFVNRNMISRHARTRDGEKMIALARAARPLVGGDEFAVNHAHKLGVELYLGRFGAWVEDVEQLNRSTVPWLITCDRGLIELGATKIIERDGGKVEVMRPRDLGEVKVETGPVISQKWGRMYLIRLRRPIRVYGTPRVTPHASGRQDGW